jgi:hypothetical protein
MLPGAIDHNEEKVNFAPESSSTSSLVKNLLRVNAQINWLLVAKNEILTRVWRICNSKATFLTKRGN